MYQAHFTRESGYYFAELWWVSFWVQDGAKELHPPLRLFLRWDKAEGLARPWLHHDGLECRGSGIEVAYFDLWCRGKARSKVQERRAAEIKAVNVTRLRSCEL